MGQICEVRDADFEQKVLVASHDRPVVVDFFATWCGPCQLLKPMLETLAQEYDFILAKVDIDESPALAQAFRVEGVPDVRFVVNGQVQPGFVGVLPELQLRQLLAEKLALRSGLDQALDQVKQAIASGQLAQGKALLDRLFADYPERVEVTLVAAQFLLRMEQPEAALKLLGTIGPDQKPFFAQAEALRGLVALQQAIAPAQNPTPPESAHSFDAAFAAAARAALAEDYEAALVGFLGIVQSDRQYRQDGARKAMLTIFGLLGDGHPLTQTYRKQLMLALY